MKIEICLDNPNAALLAEKNGADRVELCANLLEGGTTPSAGCIAETRRLISIGLFVIIRPRGGAFYYNKSEIATMKYNISLCKELGVDGVVIGALKRDGSLDSEQTKELIALAKPMEVTFHRAFDRCKNPFETMEELIELGVNRILTSGQFPKAIDGKDLILKLIDKAQGRIIIMPGSGINPSNILELAQTTGAEEFHFTAHFHKTLARGFKHENFDSSEYLEQVFDSEKLQKSIDILKSIK